MARAFAAIGVLLALVAPAGSQEPDRAEMRALHEKLKADFESCRHPSMELSPYRNHDPHRDLLRELAAMLNAPAEACPDTPARAVAFLEATVGNPVRSDADTSLLVLLESALRQGKGGIADPVRLQTLARHLWLIGGERDVPGYGKADLDSWLAGPEAVALLEARIAAAPTVRAVRLRSEQLLDRSRGDFNPGRAADLLESGPAKHEMAVRLLLGELLSDGQKMKPDFARAAALFRYEATGVRDRAEAQRALLRIGRRAAKAARTEPEHMAALAILAPAALDGIDDSESLYRRQLARVRAPLLRAPLPADRLDWIHAEMDFAFAYMLDMLPEETPKSDRPIVHQGLIGPDGRLTTVRLVRSSGAAARDHAVRSAWLGRGGVVDLSAVARGRSVWVELPPVDPMFDYSAAWNRRKARCPACS
jgi:hypothetical protein